MRELSVILAGILAWIGCAVMLIMPITLIISSVDFSSIDFSRINFFSKKSVGGVILVITMMIIPATAFWLFFRMYKNCRNKGLSSSELYERLAFPFCIIPIGAIGATVLLLVMIA
jgi:hypothetical protein